MAFPVPRHELPSVFVTPDEHYARKHQMQRMVSSLVEDYEYFVTNARQVNKRRWKSSTSRDRLKLYKERKSSSGLAHFTASGEFRSDSDADTVTTRSTSTAGSIDSTMAMTNSEESAEMLRMTLMVGEYAGRMENAMYAVIANNHNELSLVDIFLHEDVADCAILHRMEGPTDNDPYHFLGYKWMVRKSPTSAHIIRHRDSVYVEYSGLTKTTTGVELGYHIMHSVDLMGFPELRDRNCLRSSMSIRALYRQLPGNVVEVYIMGNLALHGMLMSPIAAILIQETLFNMPKLIDCGEAKRLTKMLFDLRDLRVRRKAEKAAAQKGKSPEPCSICRQQKKRFLGSIAECDVCGTDACDRCRMHRRVFMSQGILGRFYKVTTCTTCVLVAKNAKFFGTDINDDDEELALSRDAAMPMLDEDKEDRYRTTSSDLTVSSMAADSEYRLATYSVSSSTSSQDSSTSIVRFHHHHHHSHAPSPAYARSYFHDRLRLDSSSSADSSSPYHYAPSSYTSYSPQSSTTRSSRQAELYMKMLELQRKAQDAYDTAKQTQRFLDGRRG